MIFDIILILTIIFQFIYLFKRINKMAAIDDLKTIVSSLQLSANNLLTFVQSLKDQVANSVSAADVEAEVAKLQSINDQLNNAQN